MAAYQGIGPKLSSPRMPLTCEAPVFTTLQLLPGRRRYCSPAREVGADAESGTCAALLSASSWRPMPRPAVGMPRQGCLQVCREWGRMRTPARPRAPRRCEGRRCASSSLPALKHGADIGAPQGRRTACRHSRSCGRAGWETRGRGCGQRRRRSRARSRGTSAARPRRHCRPQGGPGQRRCRSVVARGSKEVGRGTSAT